MRECLCKSERNCFGAHGTVSSAFLREPQAAVTQIEANDRERATLAIRIVLREKRHDNEKRR